MWKSLFFVTVVVVVVVAAVVVFCSIWENPSLKIRRSIDEQSSLIDTRHSRENTNAHSPSTSTSTSPLTSLRRNYETINGDDGQINRYSSYQSNPISENPRELRLTRRLILRLREFRQVFNGSVFLLILANRLENILKVNMFKYHFKSLKKVFIPIDALITFKHHSYCIFLQKSFSILRLD